MEEGIFRDFKIVVENVQCVNVQTWLHTYFTSMLKNLTTDWPCDIMFSRNLVEAKGSYFTNTTMPSLAVILYVGTKSHHRNHFLTICLIIDTLDVTYLLDWQCLLISSQRALLTLSDSEELVFIHLESCKWTGKRIRTHKVIFKKHIIWK
jgi:hypothetical protein